MPPGPPAADIDEIMSRVDSIGADGLACSRARCRQQMIEAGTLKDIHKTDRVDGGAVGCSCSQRASPSRIGTSTETMACVPRMRPTRHREQRARRLGADRRRRSANLRQTTENAARLSANIDSTNTAAPQAARPGPERQRHGRQAADRSLLYTDMRHLVAQADSLLADFKANPRKYINLRIF